MAWPTDIVKLSRVRTLMKEQDLDALVVRAPDNLVYLSNYWCMKGYDALVFPREGDATLIALEPQLAEAHPLVQGLRRERFTTTTISIA